MKQGRTRHEMEQMIEGAGAGDNTKLVKDAIKAMKTAQSKIELMDRESSKMSPAGITGLISAMIKTRNDLELALKAKIA